MDLKTRLAEYGFKVIQAQNNYSHAYLILKEGKDEVRFAEYGKAFAERESLKEEGKSIYESIVQTMRDSNGNTTIDKIIKGEIK